MATTNDQSSSSLTAGAGGPSSNPDNAETQVLGFSTATDGGPDTAQLGSGETKDAADFPDLQYPSMEMSMEPSSNLVMYLELFQLSN
jgi:hypothetical protein